ncbi:MAG: hypothetical protein HYX75_23670 [Acidobacteria bacterium]|nr:hypothetical protein [Acidobacteriota bacterium]
MRFIQRSIPGVAAAGLAAVGLWYGVSPATSGSCSTFVLSDGATLLVGHDLDDGIPLFRIRGWRAPSESAIRRTLHRVDSQEVDKVVGKWLFEQRLLGGVSVGLDGKTLRGRHDGREEPVQLLSAVLNEEGIVVAQCEVDSKTNEIPMWQRMAQRGIDAFRQNLSRARRQLYTFMRGKCGLVDPANPCRCARKTRAFIAAGIVDPSRLQFRCAYQDKVTDSARGKAKALEEHMDDTCANLFRRQPLFVTPDFVARIRVVLGSETLTAVLAPPPP